MCLCVGDEWLTAVKHEEIIKCCTKLLIERNRKEKNNELTKEVTYIPGLEGVCVCVCVSSGQEHSFAL